MSEEAIKTPTYSTRANNKFALTGLYFAGPARADKTPDENQVFLGRLAPYLERDCLRSFTPCKSSEPRTMW